VFFSDLIVSCCYVWLIPIERSISAN